MSKPIPTPKRVDIMGKDFTIERVDLIDGKSGVAGQIDGDEARIRIKKGMSRDMEIDTVLHEIVHGIDYIMDLDLTETQVKRISSGLHCVLKQNPKLTRLFL